jgi:hypothetical protein
VHERQRPEADSEELRLVVSLGHTGDQELYLRVSSDGAGELRALMEDENIFSGEELEFSVTQDVTILAATRWTTFTSAPLAIHSPSKVFSTVRCRRFAL